LDDPTTAEIVDILAHEYGWSIDYIQELGLDEINDLLTMIVKRNKSNFRILNAIISHAIAGKELKFNDSDNGIPTMSEEEGLRQLMSKLGKGVKRK